MSTQIIRPEKLKELTGLSKNVLDDKFEPFLLAAQMTLKKVLGTTGYDELITAIEADFDLTAEPDLLTLRDDYIWPYLAWRTVELAGTRLWAEPDRNGTFTRSGDTYQSIDAAGLGLVKTDARDMAGIYLKALTDFLTDNVATYTWYDVDDCEDDNVPNFRGGIITEPEWRRRRHMDSWHDGY